MGKPLRIIRNVSLVILGLLVLSVIGLQVFVNTPAARNMIDNILSESMMADVRYSKLEISLFKSFPDISVDLDSVSLTYPHGRFAARDGEMPYSPLTEAGRGVEADTLASIDRLSLAANPWPFIFGTIRVDRLSLGGLAAFLHFYRDGTSNLDVLGNGQPADTTAAAPLTLPKISIGEFVLDGGTKAVYTASRDTVFAALSFDALRVGGDIKFTDDVMYLDRARVSMDTLSVKARLPMDSLLVDMPRLSVCDGGGHIYDISLEAHAEFVSGLLGRLDLPLTVEGCVGFNQDASVTAVDARRLDVSLASIPLSAKGVMEMYRDSSWVDASVSISRCPAGKLLAKYGKAFFDEADDIRTDAELTVYAEAKGAIAGGRVPEVHARVEIPECDAKYLPMDMGGRLSLKADAGMSPEMYVTADIRRLAATLPGASVELSGLLDDLAGADPHIIARADADADLGELSAKVPGLGIAASGTALLAVDGSVYVSELDDFHFDRSSITGHLDADRIAVSMPQDTIDVHTGRTGIAIGSDSEGLHLRTDLDSVRVSVGEGLAARVGRMANTLDIAKVRDRGMMVPRFRFRNSDDFAFVRLGQDRFAASGITVSLGAQKRPDLSSRRRAVLLDSLQRVYPGVKRDSLMTVHLREMRASGRFAQFEEENNDFARNNISLGLDRDLTMMYAQWNPSGHLTIDNAFAAMPAMPLRTSIKGLDGLFSDNNFTLNGVKVRAGTSDVSASGTVNGVRNAMFGRGVIDLDLDIQSENINANELLAALSMSGEAAASAETLGDEDQSFAVDSLTGVSVPPDSLMKVIVLPTNVDADIRLVAGNVTYSDLQIAPLSTKIRLKNRILQVTDMDIESNVGAMGLDAYYSTQSRDDISAGINISLKQMSADKIIHLLPTVDELMPALKSFKGEFDCHVTTTAQLDTNYNVLLPSLDGLVSLSGKDLFVEDAGDLKRITRLLFFRNKDIGEISDLQVNAIVHNGKVELFPVELAVDKYALALQGMQDFDTSFNYHVSILRSPFLIRFGLNIFGVPDNWRFAIGWPKYRAGRLPDYSGQFRSMQIGMAQSIRNICIDGEDNVRMAAYAGLDSLSRRKEDFRMDNPDMDREMTMEEREEIDNFNFEMEMEMMTEDAMAEIDDIIADTQARMTALQEEFEATESKWITRKIQSLKNNSKAYKKRQDKEAARIGNN